LLNLDLASSTAPAWVWLVVLAAGIGVPLRAARAPRGAGTRTPVRQAIDDHGVDPSAAATSLEERLSRLRGPSRAQLLAPRKLGPRRRPLALRKRAPGV